MSPTLVKIALSFAVLPWVVLPWASSSAEAEDPVDYPSQRANMVALIELEMLITGRETGIEQLDPRVKAALAETPRHAFVPEPLKLRAYGQGPLPVGYQQNLSSPFLIALMVQLARIEAGDVVFETGTGAGYMAAVLSRLAGAVYSLEVVEPLALESAQNLKALGYAGVRVKPGDGYYGWPEHAPYDAIIVKEAIDHIPPPLLAQLKPGGRLVIPLGPARGSQMLTLVEKGLEGRLRRTAVLPVIFSPLQGGERT